MVNSALATKAGLIAIGLIMGTLGTGVGAWLTLGREVVTKQELHSEVQEAIQSELAAILTRVEKIDAIHETVIRLEVQMELLQPKVSRLEQKLDRHMQLNGENGR